MSQPVTSEGTYQGIILEYGLQETDKSQSVAVFIRAQLDNVWSEEEKGWVDWTEYQLEGTGYLYVIKKDGSPNNVQIESLSKAAGWDGKFTSILDGTWKPTRCSFTIRKNEYQGNVSYRIEFVNEYDREPGGAGNVSADRARELDARFGASLRAVVGSAVRNSAKPTNGSKPPAPPKQQSVPVEAKADGGGDIPF